ncbi:MAG: cell division protein FtsL [Leptospirillia bacterium]
MSATQTDPTRVALVRGGAVALLAIGATLAYLWQHMMMVDLGYRIEKTRTELSHLRHKRGELLLEVARLSSLDRVERIARERLGMTEPEPVQMVRVIDAPAAPTPTGTSPEKSPLRLALHSR